MAKLKNTNKTLREILNDIRKDIESQYYSRGLKASGDFLDEMEVIGGKRGRARLTFADYFNFILEKNQGGGAKPQRMPDWRKGSRIRRWIKDKGLRPWRGYSEDQQAFLIARKIHELGTEIYRKKAQGIDLRGAFDDNFDDRFSTLSDAIYRDVKVEARFIPDKSTRRTR